MPTYALRDAPLPDLIDALAPLPRLTRELLLARGITTKGGAEEFLHPSYEEGLHDPFLMKNMERGVMRVLTAIRSKEKIVIYSDYDCDGIPGGVLLHDFFKKINYEQFQNYIPHRHAEGYGLNIAAVQELAEQGVTLMITIDCGTTDHDAIERAKELGIDTIVIDHHLPSHDGLPPAYAVINPKQEGETYPFHFLCGSGLAFKFVQGLLARGTFELTPGWEKWLLDMAGLGTLADMVPLIGENRVLAYYGLMVLRKSRRLGLRKLCRKMRVSQRELTEDDVGFMIVPRINAASRMDAPMEAFRLLTATDDIRADELASHLNRINDERKGVVGSLVKEARKRLKTRPLHNVVVMGDPRWKPALLGLVANTLASDMKRPVFLWGREGNMSLKGSCRSDGSVNVVALMEARSELFVAYGGHAFSGGFSVAREQVHVLEIKLSEAVEEISEKSHVEEPVAIDRVCDLSEVTWHIWQEVSALAPFGEGNPKPLFLFQKVEVAEVKQFGKERQHLELRLLRQQGAPLSAIGFFKKPEDFEQAPCKGAFIDLVATLERSTFRATPELRLRIVGIL